VTDRLRFGEILVRAGALERATLDAVVSDLADDGADLGELLVQRGLIDESALVQSLGKALSLPTVELTTTTPQQRALDLVPREVCEAHLLLPIEVEQSRTGEHLLVAMANPADVRAIKRVTRQARLRIRPLVAAAREIRIGIAQYYGQRPSSKPQTKRPSILAASAPSRPPSPAHALDADRADVTDTGVVNRLTHGRERSQPPAVASPDGDGPQASRESRAPLAGFRRPASLPPLPRGLESRSQRAERTTVRPSARQGTPTTPPQAAPTSRHALANIGDVAPSTTIVDSAPSVDLRRILDRYVGELGPEEEATDEVFSQFLNRYAEAPPGAHEAILTALDDAVDAASAPSTKLVLGLVRQLTHRGLIDPSALFSALERE